MKNYAIKNLNGWQNVEGKIFLGQELGMTGAEASLQRLAWRILLPIENGMYDSSKHTTEVRMIKASAHKRAEAYILDPLFHYPKWEQIIQLEPTCSVQEKR